MARFDADQHPAVVPPEGAPFPLDHSGWDRLIEAMDDPDDGDLGPPECNRAAIASHRHTAHCWGMDDPIRGEL